MKQYRSAAIGYGLLFILEVFATVWMMSGIRISGGDSALTAKRLGMLKYFTVDSNILMGIVAGILSVLNLQMLRGKRECIPGTWYYVNLASTAGVSLTMIVTVGFLSPMFGSRWLDLFKDSNFLYHLINPLASAVLFVSQEKKRARCFPATLIGLIPMFIYGVFYLINIILTIEEGLVLKSADWYGFLITGSAAGIPAVIAAAFAVTWLISLALWAMQKRAAGRYKTINSSTDNYKGN